MRLTVNVFGLDLLFLEFTTDTDSSDDERIPFGFHASDLHTTISGDRATDDTYDRSR